MPGTVGIVDRSSAMRMQPRAPISPASRRRLAGWLVGWSLQDVERDLVLETLIHAHGNRTAAAHLLGISVRTLRNKIVEYSAEGVYVPRRESQNEILSSTSVLLFRRRNRQSL
jgi:DNA-binding NtrC family response regulator